MEGSYGKVVSSRGLFKFFILFQEKILAEQRLYLYRVENQDIFLKTGKEIMLERLLEFYQRFGENEEDLRPEVIRKLLYCCDH